MKRVEDAIERFLFKSGYISCLSFIALLSGIYIHGTEDNQTFIQHLAPFYKELAKIKTNTINQNNLFSCLLKHNEVALVVLIGLDRGLNGYEKLEKTPKIGSKLK